MKRVVNFSGGVCSFLAAKRVVDRYGPNDVVLLFADVLIEDEELYQFNEEASAFLGVPITRISLEISPWELFRREGMIGNARLPICSVILKREPLDRWHRENCLEYSSVIYVGFDWTEEHRLHALRQAKPTWTIEAPMCDAPHLDKCQMIAEAGACGLNIPRAYRLGFPHNNCGMRCVRAGITHFVHLLKVLPGKFLEWECEEEATIAALKERGASNAGYTILRDRRGGTSKHMSLRDLRQRVEAGEQFPEHDWGGCGCAGAVENQTP